MGIEGEVPAPTAPKLSLVDIEKGNVPSEVTEIEDPQDQIVTLNFTFGERLLIATAISNNAFKDEAIESAASVLEIIKFELDDAGAFQPSNQGERRILGWQVNPQNGAFGYNSETARIKGEAPYVFTETQTGMMRNMFARIQTRPIPSLISLRKKLGLDAKKVAEAAHAAPNPAEDGAGEGEGAE